MPLYKYRAADANDRIVKGQIEALHETDLETQLRRVGLSLVRATITKARTRKVKSLTQQEIIGFMFQLEMLIRAGVPILSISQRRGETCGCSHRLRLGRLLVECPVAMLLVNATVLATMSLARGASSSVQRARLTRSAWALAPRHLASSRVVH